MWVTPTSASGWTNPDNARDENTSTYAGVGGIPSGGWSGWITLPISPAISCSKIRFWATVSSPTGWQIEVYYDGGWHSIGGGTHTNNDWKEVSLGVTKAVSSCQIKVQATGPHLSYARLHEFDYWQVITNMDYERSHRGVSRGVLRGV